MISGVDRAAPLFQMHGAPSGDCEMMRTEKSQENLLAGMRCGVTIEHGPTRSGPGGSMPSGSVHIMSAS